MNQIDWEKEHILFIANTIPENSDKPDAKKLRPVIEPWLTAVFQSDHLSLLLGTGITTAICCDASITPRAMGRIDFAFHNEKIKQFAESEAVRLGRGKANFEDDLRTAIELAKGLRIIDDPDYLSIENEINSKLIEFIKSLLENEKKALTDGSNSLDLFKRFLISFSSRTSTRDRLHIFTTNYDRFIEYALDAAGIYTLDRFVGKLNPIMRMYKMELDYHYNPPGIRGEPRYVEGVVRYTKLHGSLDWRIDGNAIYKEPMPFGYDVSDDQISSPFETKVIYPNSAKGVDTAYFPYSELFRDFSTATCRPNSVLVTYGYGFGDSHINSIILDMMRIPSTHLVIISYDTADKRIISFIEKCNVSQITLLIGEHYGNLRVLTENYLPKSAIDRISDRMHMIEQKRASSHLPEERAEESDDK